MTPLAQKIASEVAAMCFEENLIVWSDVKSAENIASEIISKAIEPLERRVEALDALPDEKLVVEIVSGVEGECVILNGRRIAGPKPWGGGKIVKKFQAKRGNIQKALHALKEGGGS